MAATAEALGEKTPKPEALSVASQSSGTVPVLLHTPLLGPLAKQRTMTGQQAADRRQATGLLHARPGHSRPGHDHQAVYG